jgi:hypothetical protein
MRAMRDLLEQYVTLHNEGVRTGDFSKLLALFAPDAVMRFKGIEVGPFSGTSSIAAAFRDHPPDDELELLARLPGGGRAVYGWSRRPHLPAGELHLRERNGLISELLVTSGVRS